MATQKGPDGAIATVGVVIHTRQYRDAVVAAFREARDFLAVDLGDGDPNTLPRAAHLSPDAVLLDLPEELLSRFTSQLSLALPRASLIAMNCPETEEALLPLFEKGICGFVPRDAAGDEILATTRGVLRGEFRCPPRIVVAMARRLHAVTHGDLLDRRSLTPRQVQIVRLLEQGLTNKQIAERLGIEFSTVKNHMHRLFKKLSIHRRQQAVGLQPETTRLNVAEGMRGKTRRRGS